MTETRVARVTGIGALVGVALSWLQFPLWVIEEPPSMYDGAGFARHLFDIRNMALLRVLIDRASTSACWCSRRAFATWSGTPDLRANGGAAILRRPQRPGDSGRVLKVSPETVMRDWKTAKVWLLRELGQEKPAAKTLPLVDLDL